MDRDAGDRFSAHIHSTCDRSMHGKSKLLPRTRLNMPPFATALTTFLQRPGNLAPPFVHGNEAQEP